MANFINTLFGRVMNLERTMSQMINWRSYDGSGNNSFHPNWGMAGAALLRRALPPAYADGVSSLVDRGVNPRIVSNLLCKTNQNIPNAQGLTDMTWIWGQFLDHEIDLTDTQSGAGAESANMVTPTQQEDPNEDYPGLTILFDRSQFLPNVSPREQPNNISAFIDATNVYGTSAERAYALRRLDGSGKLLTTVADNGETLMPYNLNGLPNAAPHGSNPADFFLAGDVRANENIFLTAMHTLFVREHNRLCDVIVARNPELAGKDETIYQKARKIVYGIMCYITYQEFLPNLLGSFPAYGGYNPNVNAGINTEFSTVAYRLGHTMLSSQLKTGESGTILLRDAFFSPAYLQSNGIDDLLLGGRLGVMQEIDTRIVEDVRSFLFGPPTQTNLLDLAALNMQRGRDHGIPGYNDLREAYGLVRRGNFNEISSDSTVNAGLASLYASVDDIDPWIGGLAEDHVSGGNVGELFTVIIRDQFIRLRSGDKYFYKNDPSLSREDVQLIETSTLGRVIARNTGISADLLGDVFHNTF